MHSTSSRHDESNRRYTAPGTKASNSKKRKGDISRRRRVAIALCNAVDISNGARATFVHLLFMYSDDLAKNAYPSQERLAKERCVSTRTIVRHIKEIEDAELLDVERSDFVHDENGHIRRAKTNRYCFRVPTAKPNRRKPSSDRPDTDDAQSKKLKFSIHTSFRVPRDPDLNCSFCDGTGWKELAETNEVDRCQCVLSDSSALVGAT